MSLFVVTTLKLQYLTPLILLNPTISNPSLSAQASIQTTLFFLSLSLSLSLSTLTSLRIFVLIMAKDVVVAVSAKDYHDPPPAPLIDAAELTKWSFYRALIAEFIATLLFLYITVLTLIGYKSQTDLKRNGDNCGGVGTLGIAWAFGGMIFILVYCTAGISGRLIS